MMTFEYQYRQRRHFDFETYLHGENLHGENFPDRFCRSLKRSVLPQWQMNDNYLFRGVQLLL